MSHFAKVQNGIVQEVIVAEQPFIDSGAVGDPSLWVQTSYTGSIRKNYAGIGYTYDPVLDAFYAPRPFASWTLDSACQWQAPVPYPTDGKEYAWYEATQSWVIYGGG